MTNPPIRQHQIYPDDFPPSWASDYGEDEYGLWLAFKYKGVEQRFRWCEPGVFLMESSMDEPSRYEIHTPHEVTLTQGFWLGEVPVTQALWTAFMDDNPSHFKGEQHPVEQVSWEGVQRFIQTLNGLKSELGLRLPTEAEWEYACCAGTSSAFHFGNKEDSSLDLVNYPGQWQGSNLRGKTQDVRTYPPNLWGLYQMHGNVWEWCQDWYSRYPKQSFTNPVGPNSGKYRVLRGGPWVHRKGYWRSTYRKISLPGGAEGFNGFRLALGQ